MADPGSVSVECEGKCEGKCDATCTGGLGCEGQRLRRVQR